MGMARRSHQEPTSSQEGREGIKARPEKKPHSLIEKQSQPLHQPATLLEANCQLGAALVECRAGTRGGASLVFNSSDDRSESQWGTG